MVEDDQEDINASKKLYLSVQRLPRNGKQSSPIMYVSIVSSKWVDYESVEIKEPGTNPIEFVIKPLADYINLNKSELGLVVKIAKQDGTPTGDGKK